MTALLTASTAHLQRVEAGADWQIQIISHYGLIGVLFSQSWQLCNSIWFLCVLDRLTYHLHLLSRWISCSCNSFRIQQNKNWWRSSSIMHILCYWCSVHDWVHITWILRLGVPPSYLSHLHIACYPGIFWAGTIFDLVNRSLPTGNWPPLVTLRLWEHDTTFKTHLFSPSWFPCRLFFLSFTFFSLSALVMVSERCGEFCKLFLVCLSVVLGALECLSSVCVITRRMKTTDIQVMHSLSRSHHIVKLIIHY